MEVFFGSWKLTTSENFEPLMQALGVNAITRKAGNATKPTVTFSAVAGEEGTYSMKTTSTFKNSEFNFKLGVEFDEKTLDGRRVKSTITIEDGHMKHINVGDKITEITRTVDGSTLTVVRFWYNRRFMSYPYLIIIMLY